MSRKLGHLWHVNKFTGAFTSTCGKNCIFKQIENENKQRLLLVKDQTPKKSSTINSQEDHKA